MEIVAIGGPEFSLGFEVAGVRSYPVGAADAEQAFASLLADAAVGILIVDQGTFDALSVDLREQLLRAPRPVTVVLSQKEENTELRSMIIRSIGVDLWKSDD